MANLEQNRQESLDLIQEEIDSMDVNTPLDNTKDVVDFLDRWTVIDIKEDFAEMCNILRNGTKTEKELAKLKLIVHLSKNNVNMDYDNVKVAVIKDDTGEDRIVLTEKYNDGVLSGLQICTFTNKGGKRYYELLTTA